MHTFGNALIKARDLDLEDFCRKYDRGYSRMSKLLNGHPKYKVQAGDREALSEWLRIPEDLVFADALPILEAYLADYKRRKKRSPKD